MDPLKNYSIPFVGLSDGFHRFSYFLDQEFFDLFEYSLINGGEIKVELLFEKKPGNFVLEFEYEGILKLNCDRCLAELSYPIVGKDRLLVKISEQEGDSDNEELIVISPSEHQINIAQFLYEIITIQVPLKISCEEAGKESCDPEMERFFNADDTGEDNNDNDPRWDALKKIKFNK